MPSLCTVPGPLRTEPARRAETASDQAEREHRLGRRVGSRRCWRRPSSCPACRTPRRSRSSVRWMPRMISASRASVCSNVHESRLAFCCISSAEVATPPALAALPGPKATPASRSTCTPRGRRHVGALDDRDAAVRRRARLRRGRSARSASRQGIATWHGTSQMLPPVDEGRVAAPARSRSHSRGRARRASPPSGRSDVDARSGRARSRRNPSRQRPCRRAVGSSRWRRSPRCPSRTRRTSCRRGRRRARCSISCSEEHRAVAGRFGPHLRATPLGALAR